ncbi:MAG: AAA family ATPase [Coxiellaceae bacterium]|nr:AAA family ATPase [Coxiellaceae bacterium]
MIKDNCYILTGPPGSGKTAIKEALVRRGISCIGEFAREIIDEQRSINGEGVYDKNPLLFKELMLSRSIDRYLQSDDKSLTIFDRGIPDILAYADCFELDRGEEVNAANDYRYNQTVFFAPGWEAIYSNDEDRKISYADAYAFGENLKSIYLNLDYDLVELPCSSVEERIDCIMQNIEVPNE